MRAARLALIGLFVIGCGGIAATPIVIYVTPPPPTSAAVTVTPVAPTATPSPTAAIHTITVDVLLYGNILSSPPDILATSDTQCAGNGAYSDVAPGMQATVHDDAGRILGVSTFNDPGTIKERPAVYVTQCLFETVVPNVTDSPFYAVDLGRRGSVQFSKDELRAHNWIASITIGQPAA